MDTKPQDDKPVTEAPPPPEPVSQFLGGPPPHLNDPHPMANDTRFEKYRGRKRRRRPKSKPPSA